jgi:hypothetical protein
MEENLLRASENLLWIWRGAVIVTLLLILVEVSKNEQ